MMDIHYLWSLTGGLMIGLAAGIFLLFNGRVAGVSGLAASALGWTGAGMDLEGLGFVFGIAGGAALGFALVGHTELTNAAPPVTLLLGGLLVGFGTRLGSGCTSGHGVCGLARLSPRSIVATATFMAAAALTVLVTRHLLGGS